MYQSIAAADESVQQKKGYHHGNLREALIENGLAMLEKDGIDTISLRQVAKTTGVSQAAPYSHFRDKTDLLAAIAEAGFQRLALQMAEDATGKHGTRARVEALAQSYIRFASKNQPLFHLMFGRDVADFSAHPTLALTAGKSWSLISAAISAGGKKENVATLTASIWSMVHGLTGLVIDKRLKPENIGAADLSELVGKTIGLFAVHLD